MIASKISRILPVMALSLLVAFTAGCNPKVTRVSSDAVTDLSGKWNDTDSRLVSEEMIQDVLSRPWLSRFNRKTGKVPTVIVGTIRNQLHRPCKKPGAVNIRVRACRGI